MKDKSVQKKENFKFGKDENDKSAEEKVNKKQMIQKKSRKKRSQRK